MFGRSYNDHGEEGEAHEDALHLDEQHGAGQVGEHGGVEARDDPRDRSSCSSGENQIQQSEKKRNVFVEIPAGTFCNNSVLEKEKCALDVDVRGFYTKRLRNPL